MQRSQLNISIHPELLKRIKESARKSGKSITNYVTDCCTNQVENFSSQSTDSRLNTIEERLESIEKTLAILVPGNQKITPFTPEEAIRCNDFIKALFEHEVKKKKYKSIKNAWNDLISHIECFDQWNDRYTLRLKESLFIEHGDPFSHNEMNLLTKGKECPCPIRTGLINWINNANPGQCCCSDKSFPSQQTICEKGSKLVDDIYT